MLATRKAHELDVVELLEDLTKYGLKRGERGAVVVAFDEPEEAYDLEFVDESGQSRFAYGVKPEQIKSSHEIAKEIFEQGTLLFNQGNPLEAEKEFQRAIEIDPNYIRVLHNSFIKSLEGEDEWQRVMAGMRLVLRLNPTYDYAKQNLAMAYLNHGIEKINEGDVSFALGIFYRALGLANSDELLSSIRKNIATAFIMLGIQSHKNGDLKESLRLMCFALANYPDDLTKRNVGIAYTHLAYTHLDNRDFSGAIPFFELAQDMGMITPELLNDYGVVLALSGNFGEAIITFERVLQLDPNNLLTQNNLSLAKKDSREGFSKKLLTYNFIPAQPTPKLEYEAAA